VTAVVLLSIVADVLHSQKPKFIVGQTYQIARNGVVCLTAAGLAKSQGRDAAEAEKLGCVALTPDDQVEVTELDSNETTAKVRVVAPKLPVNNFRGWLGTDNLGPEAEAEAAP
jgi:hypothetical protein